MERDLRRSALKHLGESSPAEQDTPAFVFKAQTVIGEIGQLYQQKSLAFRETFPIQRHQGNGLKVTQFCGGNNGSLLRAGTGQNFTPQCDDPQRFIHPVQGDLSGGGGDAARFPQRVQRLTRFAGKLLIPAFPERMDLFYAGDLLLFGQ